MSSEYVFNDLGGGSLKYLGVLGEIAEGLKELRVIVAVGDALVKRELAVNIFIVNNMAGTVYLIGMALGTEGDKYGQRAEIIDVMEDGPYAERAEVGDYHRTVEGACIKKTHGQPAEEIAYAKQLYGKAEKETRCMAERFGNIFSVIVAIIGLYLVYLLIHLAVDVKNSVGRLEADLDSGLCCIDGDAALDSHDKISFTYTKSKVG